MEKRSFKILLHGLPFNSSARVLKDYLEMYFQHVLLVEDPDLVKSYLVKHQFNMIVLMPEILNSHGKMAWSGIQGLNPLVPVFLIAGTRFSSTINLESNLFTYPLQGNIGSSFQAIKERILEVREREYLNWPRIRCSWGWVHLASDKILGYSGIIEDVRAKIARLSYQDWPVIISGAPGTEKLTVVKEIHEQDTSCRHDPLVMSFREEDALVSVLSSGDKALRWENVKNEQVNLLEKLSYQPVVLMGIEKMHPYMQFVLSCIIKDTMVEARKNECYRLYITVNDENKIQQDLLDVIKLCKVAIDVPELNRRKEDIPFLLHFYFSKYNRHYGKQVDISETAINKCIDYPWPGNIHELEEKVKNLVAFGSGKMVFPRDLHFTF